MDDTLLVDEPAFTAVAERHRRELHVHCYRMLASFDEAEAGLIAEITTFGPDLFPAFELAQCLPPAL